jgi:hypothetical protein
MDYYKCFQGLGVDHFYVKSPCIKDYTEIFYFIYKANVPSIQCKMSLNQSTSMTEIDDL